MRKVFFLIFAVSYLNLFLLPDLLKFNATAQDCTQESCIPGLSGDWMCNPPCEPRLDEQGTCRCTITTPTPTQSQSSNCLPTAIGCIDVINVNNFVKEILKIAIGIGGGIAFLLMLIGALLIMTSRGKPEQLQAGKELIGSALTGLLFIIFSLFLLELIGVKILQIPDFATK